MTNYRTQPAVAPIRLTPRAIRMGVSTALAVSLVWAGSMIYTLASWML
ncbi:morphogenic membrane protein MmpA [Streptomyces sp. DT24]|nr:hypothetical protein [Streptomyces sp. AM 4-1-1]WEH36819.1 hypothetical protein PZB75_27770 [Streptomyces sp. AM 4-1-1]